MLTQFNNEIPIVIVHTGYSKSLYYSIASCRRTNPNSNIFLVGDKPYKKLEKISTFVDIKSIEDTQSTLFQKMYVHLGKSQYNFEMFCIKRWFLYRNVIKQYNLQNAFCMDSDILIFSNLHDALKPFANYRISLMLTYGSSMLINDVSILDEFCNYLISLYTDKNELSKLKDMYYNSDRVSKGVAGTISDMTLSNMFFSNYKNRDDIGDIGQIVNNSVFDYNITTTEQLLRDANGYKILENIRYQSISKSRYKVKDIYFENGKAYCMYRDDNGVVVSNVNFHSLHFTVWCKILMKYAFNYKKIKLNPTIINISREYKVFRTKLKKYLHF